MGQGIRRLNNYPGDDNDDCEEIKRPEPKNQKNDLMSSTNLEVSQTGVYYGGSRHLKDEGNIPTDLEFKVGGGSNPQSMINFTGEDRKWMISS